MGAEEASRAMSRRWFRTHLGGVQPRVRQKPEIEWPGQPRAAPPFLFDHHTPSSPLVRILGGVFWRCRVCRMAWRLLLGQE
jgi:hypothetical protein